MNTGLKSKKDVIKQVAYQLQRVAQPSCQEEAWFRYGLGRFCLRLLNRRLLFKVYMFTGHHVIDFRQIHWPTEAWFPRNVVEMKEEKAVFFVSGTSVVAVADLRERPGGGGGSHGLGGRPPPPPPLSEGLDQSLCGFVATVRVRK